MSFNQIKYIDNYNKGKYKMYQFRVKKDSSIIEVLDNKKKRNSYIISLIEKDNRNSILKLKDIKSIIKPILLKYGIEEVYLFGSYSRGEANENSDVDIYCERGNVESLDTLCSLENELKDGLGKNIDLIFKDDRINDYLFNQITKDLIKLC